MFALINLRCQDVLRWWSARYRDEVERGILYRLSPKDERFMHEWMDRYQLHAGE